MKQFLCVAIIACIAFVLPSCDHMKAAADVKSGDSTAGTTDVSKVKAMMQSVNDGVSVAFKAKDSVALTANYTSDAVMLPPNTGAVSGTDQIRGLWHYFIGLGFKDLKITTGDAWVTGNTAVEQGTWSLTDMKDAVVDHGKFLVLWKEEAGKWKLFRDCWNSDLPLPAMEPTKK
jgi:ketosteroid isomerase-like protein